MTENEILNALSQFIKTVTADIRLIKGGDKKESELVPPAVYIGWLPPKNYLTEYGYDIPGIIISMDEAEDDGEEAKMGIRLTFGVYSPGIVSDGQYIPDAKGYIDLLHLMTQVRLALLGKLFIGGKCEVQKPIKWGMYQEQEWPYWHGWMMFDTPLIVQGMKDSEIDSFLKIDSQIQIPVKAEI